MNGYLKRLFEETGTATGFSIKKSHVETLSKLADIIKVPIGNLTGKKQRLRYDKKAIYN